MALALADHGASIWCCGRREEPLQETQAVLADRGHVSSYVTADITLAEDRQRLVEALPPVDVLVNDAGYAIRAPWLEVQEREWREVMTVNVEAPFFLAQLVAPGMVERGWGRIVNVASIYGVVAGDPARYPGHGIDIASYFASKHALVGLTKHLAVMLGGSGVTVNALSPGMFPSPPNEAVLSDDVKQALRGGTPVGRLGSETDLRAAIVYLASPGASFVTGQNVIVDGGWTVW
jgi:NAD(P)-dependent dehydrogenase (short-subunit alcohol dehydrogenase family)